MRAEALQEFGSQPLTNLQVIRRCASSSNSIPHLLKWNNIGTNGTTMTYSWRVVDWEEEEMGIRMLLELAQRRIT